MGDYTNTTKLVDRVRESVARASNKHKVLRDLQIIRQAIH